MEEIEFFRSENVSVTNARFMVGAKTYAMNGVTSVKKSAKTKSKIMPILFVLAGIVIFFATPSITARIVASALVIIGIFAYKAIRPEYSVVLNSASGESQALASQDEKYIDTIIDALNQSIVHRG